MASWKQIEHQSRRQSILFTLLFAGALVVAMLLISFKAPEPEDPSLGIEGLTIDFGFDQTGFGTNEFTPEQTASSSEPKSSVNEDVMTQDVEETVPVVKKETTKTNTTKTETTSKTETLDPNLSFSKDKLNNKGGDGNTTGNGNMGSPDGQMDGAYGPGGGRGDDGTVGWDLSGRGKVSLPYPPKAENEEGDIRVRISVDQNGSVVEAKFEQSGSNITNITIINQAVAAARKAKFTPNPKAETIQIGYITYHYRYE